MWQCFPKENKQQFQYKGTQLLCHAFAYVYNYKPRVLQVKNAGTINKDKSLMLPLTRVHVTELYFINFISNYCVILLRSCQFE